MIRIYFIRHALTKSVENGSCLGVRDELISPEGARNIQAYVEEGRYPKADIVFCADNERSRKTAVFIYPFEDVILLKDLCEIDSGEDFFHFSNRIKNALMNVLDFIIQFLDGNRIPYSKSISDVHSLCSEDINVVIIADQGSIVESLSHSLIPGSKTYDFTCDCGRGFVTELMSAPDGFIKLKYIEKLDF